VETGLKIGFLVLTHVRIGELELEFFLKKKKEPDGFSHQIQFSRSRRENG
jgi:hypothetical protein